MNLSSPLAQSRSRMLKTTIRHKPTVKSYLAEAKR